MKWSLLVLCVCSTLYTCQATTFLPPLPQNAIPGCQLDEECTRAYGVNCFCVKPISPGSRGECICSMDPAKMVPPQGCFADDDCKHTGINDHACWCYKPQGAIIGECKCIAPIG